jgi:hypothetical protein
LRNLYTLEDMLVNEESMAMVSGFLERRERVFFSTGICVDFLLLREGPTAEELESMEDSVGALAIPFTCKGVR